MNTIPRYFDFGNHAKIENGFFKYDESQPLLWAKVDENATNIIPEIFKNDQILLKYFLFDILKKELSGLNEEFGVPFSKNVKKTTWAIFSKENDRLIVRSIKSYSRRLERKRRNIEYRYPSFYIHNRVKWFLENSPFVKSFRIEKVENGYFERYSFFINWQ